MPPTADLGTPPRHPVTGRFLAFDCEIDCLEHCAGLCGEAMTLPPIDGLEIPPTSPQK